MWSWLAPRRIGTIGNCKAMRPIGWILLQFKWAGTSAAHSTHQPGSGHPVGSMALEAAVKQPPTEVGTSQQLALALRGPGGAGSPGPTWPLKLRRARGPRPALLGWLRARPFGARAGPLSLRAVAHRTMGLPRTRSRNLKAAWLTPTQRQLELESPTTAQMPPSGKVTAPLARAPGGLPASSLHKSAVLEASQ